MKTSTFSRKCIRLGSGRSDHFINRPSYELLVAFFDVPPTRSLIHDGVIRYEVSHSAVLMGDPEYKYYIDVDYKGTATENISIKSTLLKEGLTLSKCERGPFFLDRYSIFDETVNSNPFLIRSDSAPIMTLLMSVKRTFEFVYDGFNIRAETCEVMMNPFYKGDQKDYMYFCYDPIYTFEIFTPINFDQIDELLQSVLPKVFFQN
jgi:hypothetical protein